jgi:hypothetical protein
MDVSYFVNKLPEKSTHRNTIEMAGGAVARFSREIADIKSDRRFTAAGHAEKIKAAAEKALPYFADLRALQGNDRKALERRQAAIKLKPVDRGDLWAEHRAREARDYLRTIPLHERQRLALADPLFAEAILNAPPALSGVDGDFRERLIQVELERLFGAEELEAIAEESKALDVVDEAIKVTEEQFLRDAGMSKAGPTPVAA